MSNEAEARHAAYRQIQTCRCAIEGYSCVKCDAAMDRYRTAVREPLLSRLAECEVLTRDATFRAGRHDIQGGTPAREPVADGIRRDPRNGKVAEGTWPIACEQRAFVNGAKWWEWQTNSATMFPSDQQRAAEEAVRLYGEPTPEAGTVTEAMALAAAKESARISGAPWSDEDIAEFWPDLKDEWVSVVTAALAGRRGA